jgi:hypothetical protein
VRGASSGGPGSMPILPGAPVPPTPRAAMPDEPRAHLEEAIVLILEAHTALGEAGHVPSPVRSSRSPIPIDDRQNRLRSGAGVTALAERTGPYCCHRHRPPDSSR